jgi:hypothetical protein
MNTKKNGNAGQATVALLALAPVLAADRRLAEVALGYPYS